MISIIRGSRAYQIARRHHPVFRQDVQSPYDIPTEINKDRLQFPPPIYYWVRMDKDYYYIGYALYHSQDWARGLAKLWDEHKHDFEGVLIRTAYYLPHHAPPGGYDCISIAHHDMLTAFDIPYDRPYFDIESQGHAIRPTAFTPDNKNIWEIRHGSLISLDDINPDMITYWKKLLNPHGVHFPDQWEHQGRYKGWLWHSCDKIFDKLK